VCVCCLLYNSRDQRKDNWSLYIIPLHTRHYMAVKTWIMHDSGTHTHRLDEEKRRSVGGPAERVGADIWAGVPVPARARLHDRVSPVASRWAKSIAYCERALRPAPGEDFEGGGELCVVLLLPVLLDTAPEKSDRPVVGTELQKQSSLWLPFVVVVKIVPVDFSQHSDQTFKAIEIQDIITIALQFNLFPSLLLLFCIIFSWEKI
jgi:hypothetical protein